MCPYCTVMLATCSHIEGSLPACRRSTNMHDRPAHALDWAWKLSTNVGASKLGPTYEVTFNANNSATVVLSWNGLGRRTNCRRGCMLPHHWHTQLHITRLFSCVACDVVVCDASFVQGSSSTSPQTVGVALPIIRRKVSTSTRPHPYSLSTAEDGRRTFLTT